MIPKSKIKDAVIEMEKHITFAGELLATSNMATGGAHLGAKFSQIESGGPSMLSMLPTRRPPPEKVKTHTVSVPPKDTDQDDNAQHTQLTYTEETTAMEQNQCPCGLLFNSREDLNTHIAGHKPSNWNCSQCSKVYDSRGVLYKHYREKHIGVFQYDCKECEYGNDERVHMVHHMFHKHGVETEGIIKCPNEGCNYVVPQKCILLSHIDTCGEAKENKKHKCTECGQGYRSKKYLRLHMAADHPTQGEDVKQYPCSYPDCEKIYKSPDTLRTH